MMTQAKTRTLMMATTVVLAVVAATDRLGSPNSTERERGSQSLEWALIAAIVVGLVAVVAFKITSAVTSHAAQIK